MEDKYWHVRLMVQNQALHNLLLGPAEVPLQSGSHYLRSPGVQKKIPMILVSSSLVADLVQRRTRA